MAQHQDLVAPDSYITKFYQQAQNEEPESRGKSFEKSEEIKTEHKSASQQGQTAARTDCDSHFIAFVHYNGSLWELDGMKKCPVNLGECTENNFLQQACAEVKKYMDRDPNNINFSTIVLAKAPE